MARQNNASAVVVVELGSRTYSAGQHDGLLSGWERPDPPAASQGPTVTHQPATSHGGRTYQRGADAGTGLTNACRIGTVSRRCRRASAQVATAAQQDSALDGRGRLIARAACAGSLGTVRKAARRAPEPRQFSAGSAPVPACRRYLNCVRQPGPLGALWLSVWTGRDDPLRFLVLAAFAQEVLQLWQRPGVDHIVRGQPAALRCSDAIPQVVKVHDGVGVAVDGEPDPGVPGRADVIRWQVKPVRMGVDLQRGAGPDAGLEQLGEIDIHRRPGPPGCDPREAQAGPEGRCPPARGRS